MDIRHHLLPAGVGLQRIEVYREPAFDGSISGSPHFHIICSEFYYVLAGSGEIEYLSFEGVQRLPLSPGVVVFHRPGVLHCLLNPHQNLQILSIMQAGDLPERQDFILTFPSETLASSSSYTQATRVQDAATALRRRDAALQGYTLLRDTMIANREKGRELLRKLYRQAQRLITPKVPGFEWVLQSGAQAELKAGLDACDFLRMGRTEYLERGHFAAAAPLPGSPKYGMMGVLYPYAVEETFLVDGKKTD